LAIDGGWWWAYVLATLTPRKESLIPIELEAMWVPKLMWTLWRLYKSLAIDRNVTKIPQFSNL